MASWIGDAARLEGELCSRCFTPALLWVPYYTYGGADPLSPASKLQTFRRVRCMSCGLTVTEPM